MSIIATFLRFVSFSMLRVQRLNGSAIIPTRASSGAAGYDLYASEQGTILAGKFALVHTGISIAVPPGHYGRIAPRSGLAVKKGIQVGAGVIDEDYRGPVGIVLFNHGAEEFTYAPGDRIAQLVLEKISVLPIDIVDALDDTNRGSGGFGSTGV